MGLYEQLVNRGAFTGKQMKTINAFTTSASGSYLSTPFFCGDSLIATDTFTAVRLKKDTALQTYFDNDSEFAYKIPDSVLKKTLVSDVYCFANYERDVDSDIVKYPKGKDPEHTAMRPIKELKTTGDQVISMFEDSGQILNPDEVEAMHLSGFNPKFMKQICELMEAFNVNCFNFNWYKFNNAAIIKVVCPSYPELSVLICPMKDKH